MLNKRLLLMALLLAASARAATWRVEKDGSGEFTIIQDAVNASASGDTIMIGPGRFDDTVMFTTPYVTWTVCVSLSGQDLTFIGAGKDATFIGPAVPGEMTNDGWRGFANWPLYMGRLVIEDATIENMFNGLHVRPASFEMRNCRLSECYDGILIFESGSPTLIERCEFVENHTGIDIRGCSSPTIRDCSFVDSDIGMATLGILCSSVEDILVEDCTFEVPTPYFQISSGTIRNCSVMNSWGDGIHLDEANFTIENTEIDGTEHEWSIKAGIMSEVQGRGNILRGASWSAVALTWSVASFSQNHIFSDADFVYVNGFTSPPAVEIDFRNNYWGTTDPLELAARIKDGNDDPSIYAHVLYEPFSNVPMSNEERSWGEIKALYKQ